MKFLILFFFSQHLLQGDSGKPGAAGTTGPPGEPGVIGPPGQPGKGKDGERVSRNQRQSAPTGGFTVYCP